MTHHDDIKPDYPTTPEFLTAGKIAVDYLRGGSVHTHACLVKAGWVVAGYAGSFIKEGDGPYLSAVGGTTAEQATLLEGAMVAAQGKDATMKAFDWKGILRLALEFLYQLLNR